METPQDTNTPSQGPASATPAVEQISIEHFAKIKFRVAQIEAVEIVPKSKKLLRLQINLGEQLGKRQILSGVAQHYTPEALIGRKIIVVSNLQPAMLMGLESQGMLLAASTPDNSKLIIVDPGQDMPLGSEVR